MVQMQAQRPRQNNSLQILALGLNVIDGVAMADFYNILSDNGTVVQLLGGIMRRRPDNFHAAVKSLLVRVSSRKSRQKRMVDIDDFVDILPDKPAGQNLHVPRHNHQIYVQFPQKRHLPVFLFSLLIRGNGKMKEAEPKLFDQIARIGMIADDRFHPAAQLAQMPSQDQVVQTMQVSGNENGHAGHIIRKMQSPFHAALIGQRLERHGNLRAAERKAVQLPFHAHEKDFSPL